MNQHTPKIQERIEIEQILAPLADAIFRLSPVLTRMVQRAKTEDEALDIQELLTIKRQIQTAQKRLSELHNDKH